MNDQTKAGGEDYTLEAELRRGRWERLSTEERERVLREIREASARRNGEIARARVVARR